MLSKEEIEGQRELWNKGHDYFPESRKFYNDLCDLALVGLSVQEGLKDAREAFEAMLATKYPGNQGLLERHPIGEKFGRDGQYRTCAIEREWRAWEEAWNACAAFALKQKGEVLWEGTQE